MMELKMSASDSTASAMSACEWPKKPGEKFRDGQRDVRGEAEERGAQTALQAGGGHKELLTTKHAKYTKEFSNELMDYWIGDYCSAMSPHIRKSTNPIIQFKSGGKTSRRAASARTRCSWAA